MEFCDFAKGGNKTKTYRSHSTYLNYHKMSATVCESAVRMFEKSQFPELS